MKHEDKVVIQLDSVRRPKKQNVLILALKILEGNLKIDAQGNLFLNIKGNWAPTKLDDVMRATNHVLVKQGRPQITTNPNWQVSV